MNLSCCCRNISMDEDDSEVPSYTELTNYLIISGFFGLDKHFVESLGVTSVVNCINGFKRKMPDNVSLLHLPLEDIESEKIGRYFDNVTTVIENHRIAGGKTLVFCAMGISRSATFCLAYMMRFQKMTLRDAYLFLQKKRHEICPNSGFFEQLIEYEKQLFNTNVSTVKMIQPTPTVACADVVWEELTKEVEKARLEGTLNSMDSFEIDDDQDKR